VTSTTSTVRQELEELKHAYEEASFDMACGRMKKRKRKGRGTG
jgi:hypothetical protein